MPFVYILQNEGGKYYVGSTDNLNNRIRHHKGGHTPSTYRMGKLELVFSQKFESLADARKIETKLKRLKRHDYIANIVRDGFIKIKPQAPR